MTLLIFPPGPNNGDIYPVTPLPGQSQYQWESATQTWRLLGPATTVVPGTYGDATNVARFTVDAQGRVTFAQNVPITVLGTVTQIDTGLGLTGGPITGAGTICAVEADASNQGILYGCTTSLLNNVSLGFNSLSLATGGFNTSVGQFSLLTNTSGFRNTAIGYNGLCANLDGDANTAVGSSALQSNITGNRNTALGSNALGGTTSGSSNTAIGFDSSRSLTTNVCGNVSVGAHTLCTASLASYNVALGFCAGTTVTTGCKNVLIGPNATPSSGTGSCQLAIGFDAGQNWITGDCNKNIRLGAGLRDCLGCLGAPGQFLTSTGSTVFWCTAEYLGTVTCIGTGTGLSGGPIRTTGTLSLNKATTSALGGVIPDGTTITVDSNAVISAVQDQYWVEVVSPSPYVTPSFPGGFAGLLLGPGVFSGTAQLEGTSTNTNGNRWVLSDNQGGGSLEFSTSGTLTAPTSVKSTRGLSLIGSADGTNDTPITIKNQEIGIGTTSPLGGVRVSVVGNSVQQNLLSLQTLVNANIVEFINSSQGTLPQASISWTQTVPGVTNVFTLGTTTSYLEVVSGGEWSFNNGAQTTLGSDATGNVSALTSFVAPGGSTLDPRFKFPDIAGETYGVYSETAAQSTGLSAGGNYVEVQNAGILEAGSSASGTAFQVDTEGGAFGRAKFYGTSALGVPSGAQVQRPSVPIQGEVRFNTDTNAIEVSRQTSNVDWVPLASVVGSTVPNPPYDFIPTASTDPGELGQLAYDSTYLYAYDGTRWQRVSWDTTAW